MQTAQNVLSSGSELTKYNGIGLLLKVLWCTMLIESQTIFGEKKMLCCLTE